MKELQGKYEGEWWLPSDETRKFGGILELGDIFELRFWGDLEDTALSPIASTAADTSTIHGRSGGSAFTLLGGSIGRSTTTMGGGSTVTVRVPIVLEGVYWLENRDEALFNKVLAGIDGLISWEGRSGVERSFHEDGRRSIEYTPVDDMRADIGTAMIRLGHGYQISNQHIENQIKLQESASLIFELTQPTTLEDIDYKYIRPFRYLVGFAGGSDANASELRVANNAHLDDGRAHWLNVGVYGRGRQEDKGRKRIRREDFLFKAVDVDFGELAPRWYALVEKLGITSDLVFSIHRKENRFVGNQLFTIAAAAEGMHQRLYPELGKKTAEQKSRLDEIYAQVPGEHLGWLKSKLAFSHTPTFAERMVQLVEHAGAAAKPFVGDVDKWVRLVKNMRNQIAHALRERSEIETNVIKLARLTSTVDVVLRLVMLRELGFDDSQCIVMADKIPQWSHLRTILPTELPEIF